MQKTDRTALLGYLTAPISGSAADGPSFHLHRMRITFRLPGRIRPYGPSPVLFQNFIASGMQTFDRGMYRYVDPHTRMPGVRIVRIINSETEST